MQKSKTHTSPYLKTPQYSTDEGPAWVHFEDEMGRQLNYQATKKELKYLDNHPDVKKAFPLITNFLLDELGDEARYQLELMEEGPEWTTLFINVWLKEVPQWEKHSKIADRLFHLLINHDIDVARKVNIDFLLDEV